MAGAGLRDGSSQTISDGRSFVLFSSQSFQIDAFTEYSKNELLGK